MRDGTKFGGSTLKFCLTVMVTSVRQVNGCKVIQSFDKIQYLDLNLSTCQSESLVFVKQ